MGADRWYNANPNPNSNPNPISKLFPNPVPAIPRPRHSSLTETLTSTTPTVTRYNAGVIPGFTTVAQVEACVEAFKLEPLPAALNEEVDAIHERYRNPSAAYANKELVQTAPWLEDAMRPKEEL